MPNEGQQRESAPAAAKDDSGSPAEPVASTKDAPDKAKNKSKKASPAPDIKAAVSISIAYPDKTKIGGSFLLPTPHLMLLLLLLWIYPDLGCG